VVNGSVTNTPTAIIDGIVHRSSPRKSIGVSRIPTASRKRLTMP
jgi:hypothetical protein